MTSRIARDIAVGVASAVGTAGVLWTFAQAGGFVEEVLIPDLPGGAVVAFDGACPTGSTDFANGAGKVLLGAGDGQLVATGPHNGDRNPGDRIELTPVALGAQGGYEEYTLTEDEMPRHRHFPHADIDRFVGFDTGVTGNTVEYRSSNTTNIVNSGVTDFVGSSVPHNNMPPYVAVYFCKKVG
ncbi:MAG: hypothetical protein AAFQ51_15435 [Pseudomonadota bacterium]